MTKEKSVFTAEERAEIMNAINELFREKDMPVDAVGYDDTNGVVMEVLVMRKESE